MVSGSALLFGLCNTLAIFILLDRGYGFVNRRFPVSTGITRSLVLGLVFGVFALCCMVVPLSVGENVVDQRTTIVVLSGVFGGPIVALICSAIVVSFSAFTQGIASAAGFFNVVLAAITGSIFFYLRPRLKTPVTLVGAALIATLAILPGALLSGNAQQGIALLTHSIIAYGVVPFMGIVLAGWLLIKESMRLTAEVTQRSAEKQYQELFESIIDVYYQTDAEGNFTVISPSSVRLFGYATEEVLGKKIANCYRYPERREELLYLLGEQGFVENFDAEIRKKDGSFTWVLINAKQRKNAAGIFCGVVGVTRDISQLKRAEEEKLLLEESLRQSQKMEAVGMLAGGIAHDFNNILGAIIGYTELAAYQLSADSDVHADLSSVLAAANRAKELTRHILMFSHKGKPRKELVVVHEVVEEAINLLKKTIPSTVSLIPSLDTGTGCIVADQTQILQVVLNLCTNAFHALSDEQGTIAISLSICVVDAAMVSRTPALIKGEYVAIAVQDTGAGIDSENLNRIFEPFFTTKEQGKGTGMGLAVAQGIVLGHGGAITVTTTPGLGSTFTVYLPHSSEQSRVQPGAASVSPRGSENIFLIDDEESLVRVNTKILETLGYSVTAATSAVAALEIFRANPGFFHLVLTDQTMPGISGELLAEQMLMIRPDTAIIIATGHSGILNEERVKAQGVRAILTKPYNRQTLAEVVRSVLDVAVR